MLNFSAFYNMLWYLLLGMMGIFAVVLVIIVLTYGITIFSTLINRKMQKKD